MTACATETGPTRTDTGGGPRSAPLTLVPPGGRAPARPMPPAAVRVPPVARTGFTVAAGGAYAACLADAGDGAWYAERWTLGGPEPYTVPLPVNQPEEPDAQVQPLPDGRVLVLRRSGDRHDLALLYPTGPGTGQVPVGFLYGDRVRLLPPRADGRAYALVCADGAGTVWLVHGGPGLERCAGLDGRCAGGVWLDRAGRLLALERERDGPVTTVAVDVATGAVSHLLHLADGSRDRLLLADPDSGLLLVRSDAPGTERLGWGVLGGGRPVRFPECLREEEESAGRPLEPVAVQPGHPLAPESCAVLLRCGGRSALWRPGGRGLGRLPTPPGWLAGSAWWPAPGTLRMPYAGPGEPYGVRDIPVDVYAPPAGAPSELTSRHVTLSARSVAPLSRVVPLQQAPLAASAGLIHGGAGVSGGTNVSGGMGEPRAG